jgi:hypothetical protein
MLLMGLLVIACAEASAQGAATSAGPHTTASPLAVSALHPVFAENRGQFPEAVRYRTLWPAPVATVTDEGLVLTLVGREAAEAGGRLVGHNVRLRFQSKRAASRVAVTASKTAPTRASYFLGNDATRWITDVPCWSAVEFEGAGSGAAVEVHGRRGILEYDLVMEAGISSDSIQVLVDGADLLVLNPNGSLDIVTPLGVIHQAAPRSWELGERSAARTRFRCQIARHEPLRLRGHRARSGTSARHRSRIGLRYLRRGKCTGLW